MSARPQTINGCYAEIDRLELELANERAGFKAMAEGHHALEDRKQELERELAAQIAGHQLTAKEASTAAIMRADLRRIQRERDLKAGMLVKTRVEQDEVVSDAEQLASALRVAREWADGANHQGLIDVIDAALTKNRAPTGSISTSRSSDGDPLDDAGPVSALTKFGVSAQGGMLVLTISGLGQACYNPVGEIGRELMRLLPQGPQPLVRDCRPEGYMLVPITPTVEMMKAFWSEWNESGSGPKAYRALVHAAPDVGTRHQTGCSLKEQMADRPPFPDVRNEMGNSSDSCTRFLDEVRDPLPRAGRSKP